MLLGIKASSDANSAEQKRLAERKRSILVLVHHHLLENGYIEAAERLQHESGGVLGKFSAADNIDLGLVLSEYEAYYEMRFDRKPKLTRKLLDEEVGGLPGGFRASAGGRGARRSASASAASSKERKEDGSGKLPSVTGAATVTGTGTGTGTGEPDFGVSGAGLGISAAEKAKRSIAEEGEKESNRSAERTERLLKPPPQFGGDGELRALANVICREIYQDSPNVHFSDIVELDEAKRLLVEAVQLPLRFPYLFTGILRPWRGILLHGPPGTGKTLLAKAVATECSTTFFNISASTLVSKWRGDSEKLVRVLFEVARYHGPSTIFLDEIDSILTSRDGEGGEHEASRRMKTELLIQMDGVKASTKASTESQISQGGSSSEQVFVMAASNLPWDLDIAVLRRLEKRVLVPLPSAKAREAMFRKYLGDRSVGLDFSSVSERTGGYSGADIELVSRESAMMPVRRLMGRIDGLDMGGGGGGGGGSGSGGGGGGGGEGIKGMIPDPPPSGPSNLSSSSSYAVSRARKSAAQAASSMQDIEALLKQDPVTLEDVGCALDTTKPSSDGKIAR
jgi:katanin p60 ATPase-containing subunit A1